MIFENNSTLLCVGDSITDAGRARPLGKTGIGPGLGFGYVNCINALVQAWNPEANLTVLNTGIGGDTIRHLKARWQTDVIDLKPDYLSIMIGVNDVWRKFDNPNNPAMAVLLDEYITIYKELIAMTKDKVKKIILITPFLSETDKNEPMMNLLLDYIATVKELAKENGFILVDMQEVFDKYIAGGMTPKAIAEDRVHPSQTGAMIIAKTFLDRCGFTFSKGTSLPSLTGVEVYGDVTVGIVGKCLTSLFEKINSPLYHVFLKCFPPSKPSVSFTISKCGEDTVITSEEELPIHNYLAAEFGNNTPPQEIIKKTKEKFPDINLKIITSETCGLSGEIEEINIKDEHGVCFKISDKKYYFGSESFISSCGLSIPLDESFDENFKKRLGTIMYFADENVVISKLCLNYKI